MKYFLMLVLMLTTLTSFSQSKQKQFNVSGILFTADDNKPLESATVYLQRVKDSSLVTYTITDQKGQFTLEGKTYDTTLNMFISYIGYKTYAKVIPVDRKKVNLGQINLEVDENLLDEVVVKATAPVTIKKDTLEFNVNSFKTKKDANVEDLLKKLPGVEVDESGKITVNGNDVSNIFVNGKPFFGDDPTITTRNLTKDIIEKVQITDTKTKSEAFTGEESESDNKTINLTIKEDKNKGVFGKASAGGGTDERYEAAAMVNLFDNDQRLSVLFGGNNINSAGFSFGELDNMYSVVGGGSGRGITTSKNAGLNYTDKLSDKVELSSDYFYSDSHSENNSASQRENILPDSRYFTDANSNSVADNYKHDANLELEIELDSTLRIDIEPSFTHSRNTNSYTSQEESRDDEDFVTNESASNSFSEGITNNFKNDLDITKKLGSKGSFLRVSITNNISKSTSENFLDSQTEVYGDNPESITRNQFTDGEQKSTSLNTGLTYRIPLLKEELSLDLKYNYRSNTDEDVKSAYDFNENSQAFNDFNTALSTDFEYKNYRSTPGLRLNYRKDKVSFNLSGSYIFRTLENKDALRPELNLKRNFEAVEMYSRFTYRFNPKSRMFMRYSLSNNTPSISQLQPFEDVSDPLNTVVGNPSLEPTTNHRLYFGFNNHNFQKGIAIWSYAGVSLDENQVVAKTTIDDNFLRNTTYTNVNGGYNVNGNIFASKTKRLDTLRTLKLGVGFNGSVSKSINFNNNVKYSATNTSLSPSLELTFNWKDIMEITPRYSVSFTENKFDLDQFSNQDFKYQTLGIRTSTFVPKKLEWRNDVNYTYNPNVGPGFQKSAWFWNTTLAYSILKNNGTISLKAYDLLNQNTNARRIATGNYIQDSQSTVLQRYFMLTFSWKFNSLGKTGGMMPPPPPPRARF
ncbi:outer membrane beta-barrel protein [Cellulophaga fucicola]|uniref:Outer membrane receptor proteins, mostly Fe transport n=1 Tax=Cellulophaga fucicola TaxID=76595 RepID=A0A1K1QXI8_9FLAO|nr:outer membrane beta-barrel protein [Cellulophaga fucicola]SFW64501.1 Outer membrane receptor proteins, mostly Fe transport [Cellulophaga fucicola]